jgi:hypothetical protein
MGDFGSLYFLNRHTFVCGTLFSGIKLNKYKSAILANILDVV